MQQKLDGLLAPVTDKIMMLLPPKRKAGECCCTLRDNYPPYQQLTASNFGQLWLIFFCSPGGDGGSKEKEAKSSLINQSEQNEDKYL